MAQRRLHGLQRVLGVNALFATAYGNVGSSIYYALGLVAALALGLTPVVFIIAGALFYCTATTYAEATSMYPEAGGASLFARRAFNEFWSFFTAWAQMLNYVITIAISAFFAAHYAGGVALESLKHAPYDIMFAAGLVALLALVNVRGVSEAVGVNLVLAIVDFLSQLAIVAVGVVLVFSPDVLVRNLEFFGTAPTLSEFLLAIPIGTIAYTGIETISNMAGEARDEERTIPASIRRVMLAVFAIYFTLPMIALSALPVRCDGAGENCTTLLGVASEDGGYATDPIVGIVSAMDLGSLQAGAEVYVGVLAVTILVAATNAGVLGVSRLTYSMGLHRQLPDRLRQLHPRYGTPAFGIVLFSALAIIAILPGQAEFLGSIYAFGAMLSFSMAHLAVIRLRASDPGHRRPYRSPGAVPFRGHVLPPFALLGLLGTGLSFVVVSALDVTVAAAGFLWLSIGMAVYVVYRRRQGLDLTSTVKVATPQPVVEREAEYESILVAFDVNHFVPDAIATAQKLAARRRRGIHVVAWITVPNSAPVDASMPEQELAAQALIEQAKLLGGRRVSGHLEKIRAGQAGRLVIQQAREMRAAAIVMPLPPRVRGSSLFGSTLETVLTERPCRVIIESVPGAERGGAEQRRAAAVSAG
ncbi:MAG TPA: universal stress protein [Solirubrobacteraceae bacterium]|jgi:APA family basic amino acid/polyamine antiporter|nr:universal stress protein [Solirubrobacteraceae bacterium]